MSRVSLSRSNISSASSTSSRQIKLRTVLKNRGSQTPLNQQQIRGQSIRAKGLKGLQQDDHRKSMSLNLNKMSRLSQRSSKYSESRNTKREVETQNCQEELLGKRDNNYMYKVIMNKLNEIEKEAEMLICKKIKKMNKKSALLSMKNKGKDEITDQIERLIQKIKSITIQELEKHVSSKQMMREFADKKINILEKLMAQKSAESDALKNYFFLINTLNSQEKGYHQRQGYDKIEQLGKLNNSKLMPILKRQRARTEAKQPVSNQSLNKQSYPAPKLDQYETYRYKTKGYVKNTQPLPRSSYKREYLFYNPQQVETKLKNLDNHVNIGISRIKSSTYEYDYKPVKADLINFKELDGYKNKIKNIQISYQSNYRKEKSSKELEKSKSYFLDQQSINSVISAGKYKQKNMFSFDVKQKVENRSEAKDKFRQFDKPVASTIKHKRLDKYKYAFKTLANT